MKRTLVALSISLAFVAATAAERAAPVAPSLDELMRGPVTGAETTGIPEIRFNAIVETARTRGNSAGLAWQSANILKRLDSVARDLDIIYNFGALMMEGNVLPPVMSRALDVYDQQADSMIRLVGESYVVRQSARFTYVAPSWRSYLVFSEYTFDPSLTPQVVPQGDKERDLWNKALAEGYAMGVEQANAILEQNFNRLKADFEGMRLYRELLKKGMVTKPFVSAGHFGVTGDKDKTLNIGESILKISATPEFVLEADKWKVKPDGQTAELLKAAEKASKGEKAK